LDQAFNVITCPFVFGSCREIPRFNLKADAGFAELDVILPVHAHIRIDAIAYIPRPDITQLLENVLKRCQTMIHSTGWILLIPLPEAKQLIQRFLIRPQEIQTARQQLAGFLLVVKIVIRLNLVFGNFRQPFEPWHTIDRSGKIINRTHYFQHKHELGVLKRSVLL